MVLRTPTSEGLLDQPTQPAEDVVVVPEEKVAGPDDTAIRMKLDEKLPPPEALPTEPAEEARAAVFKILISEEYRNMLIREAELIAKDKAAKEGNPVEKPATAAIQVPFDHIRAVVSKLLKAL